MMRRRRVAGLALVSSLAAMPAVAQLSPGPLSAPHAALEGVGQCLACHAPRRGVAPERCLDCHESLRLRVESEEGLHARADHEACGTCHVDHHGREFSLIFWGDAGRDAFDHRQTGWPLDGAHAEATCGECHRKERLTNIAALTEGGANPETTYLGLNAACLTCHDDAHRGEFEAETCGQCHTAVEWTPARGFDHGDAAFPLLGAHADVACAECHPARSDAEGTVPWYRGVDHGRCSDCHTDPHQGRLGPTCATCHSPGSWFEVDRDGFDHDQTRFPLTGLHSAVDCAECHTNEAGGARDVAYASCADCHEDPHEDRLGALCGDCHVTDGWRQVEEAGFDHDLTRYPLRGAHLDAGCSDCHGTEPRVGLPLAHEACSDCHGDPHGEQLTSGCASCHTVEGFAPSTFALVDHEATAFPLKGAHRAVPCLDCHELLDVMGAPSTFALMNSRRLGNDTRVESTQPRRYQFDSMLCFDCHEDPHGGDTEAHNLACDACHVAASFRDVTVTNRAFDHEVIAGFALDGGHNEVACLACHPVAEGAEASRFEGTPVVCDACHDDPHFGTTLTAAGGAVDCAACHTTGRWEETSFDHGSETPFALDGAHARTACDACHYADRAINRSVVLASACDSCHDSDTLISPSPGEP